MRFSITPVCLAIAAACASSPPVAAEGSGATFVEEVVVTARKREEGLQEVPMAVSALDGTLISEFNIQTLGGQLNVEWDISQDITLTSLTGLRTVESAISYDPDSGPSDRTSVTFGPITESTSVPTVPIRVAPAPITLSGVTHDTGIDQEFFSKESRPAGEPLHPSAATPVRRLPRLKSRALERARSTRPTAPG